MVLGVLIWCWSCVSHRYTNKLLRVAKDAPDAKKEAMRAYVKTLKELGVATKE